MLNTTGAGSFSAPTASCFDAPDRGATCIICGYESGIVRLYDSQTGDEHDIQLADGFMISVVLSVADHRAVTCTVSCESCPLSHAGWARAASCNSAGERSSW